MDSETVVENFMTRSDVIRTHVEGIVKGARIVQTKYLSDGSVETLLSMPMKGACQLTAKPPAEVATNREAKSAQPVRPAALTPATWLVADTAPDDGRRTCGATQRVRATSTPDLGGTT